MTTKEPAAIPSLSQKLRQMATTSFAAPTASIEMALTQAADELDRLAATPSLPVPAILTDERIEAEAKNYALFVRVDGMGTPGDYDIRQYECREDFFNCVRACAELAAVPGKGRAGQWLRCTPHFILAGVDCERTPRRSGDGTYSHEHFIAHECAHPSPVPMPVAVDRNAVDAQRDAARYRWLRDPENYNATVYLQSFGGTGLDGSIDAAIALQQSADKPAEGEK
jgi:hypothetical protein